MVMYGSTMFMINTVAATVSHPSVWTTAGALPGTRSLAAGMASSGAVTAWLRELVGEPSWETLLDEAAASPPGARGLLMLPYFAGERTPVMDPQARGVVAGLTLSHTRGDLYRAALEATAFGVRHNVETMLTAGADVRRVVAVGGGAQGDLWLQVVSDVTGLDQHVPRQTIGASYGSAALAAQLLHEVDLGAWNPIAKVVRPRRKQHDLYDARFGAYRDLYEQTKDVVHRLASITGPSSADAPEGAA
jgi:xylulokinase